MVTDKFANKKIGIMGGAFNPFHIGHLRHAIEIAEELNLDAIDLLVSHNHPHKSKEGLLPFEMRVQCIEKSLQHIDFIHINQIEKEIQGKSYTDIILTEWKKSHPSATPYFLMGIEDFSALPTWHNGLKLHEITRLIVVARHGKTAQDFFKIAKTYWNNCIIKGENASLPLHAQKKAQLYLSEQKNPPQQPVCTFIDIPTLNIDATTIRKLWCSRHNISGLVHDGAIRFLDENKEIVKKYWA